MKLLRIKDNSQQKKDVFSQVAKLTGKIADKTLEQLEREGVFVFPETVKRHSARRLCPSPLTKMFFPV